MGILVKSVEIRYPKSDGIGDPVAPIPLHFAASGVSNGVVQVFGLLRHETSREPYAGGTILPPTDTGFWIIHFVRNDIPYTVTDTYTLEIYDADAILDGPLQCVSGISFQQKKKQFDAVDPTSPTNGEKVCTEFSAYGSAPFSLPVSGTLSCSGQAQEASPGPDWVLHCMVTGTPPEPCTLTVTQQGASPGSVNVTISKC